MTQGGGGEHRPLSELLSDLTAKLSTLVRQELQLAEVELRGEAVAAAKGSAALLVTSVAAVVGIRELRQIGPPTRTVQ